MLGILASGEVLRVGSCDHGCCVGAVLLVGHMSWDVQNSKKQGAGFVRMGNEKEKEGWACPSIH